MLTTPSNQQKSPPHQYRPFGANPSFLPSNHGQGMRSLYVDLLSKKQQFDEPPIDYDDNDDIIYRQSSAQKKPNNPSPMVVTESPLFIRQYHGSVG
jgi:hypothetical protein